VGPDAVHMRRPTLRGADRAYRRSLYRGLLALVVDLFRTVTLPTRRGGSHMPLGGA